MATKNLNLPRVVLTFCDYRFVALRLTTQEESYHKEKWVVSLDVEEELRIEVIAEHKSIDSLGNDRWNQCPIETAEYEILKGQILDVIRTPPTRTSKSAKTKDV